MTQTRLEPRGRHVPAMDLLTAKLKTPDLGQSLHGLSHDLELMPSGQYTTCDNAELGHASENNKKLMASVNVTTLFRHPDKLECDLRNVRCMQQDSQATSLLV